MKNWYTTLDFQPYKVSKNFDTLPKGFNKITNPNSFPQPPLPAIT